MKMKKKLIKIVSLFLSVIMLTTVMPAGVYAQEEEEVENTASSENVEDVGVEYEIESKRTENSKTYLTENGGYYQVSSAVPIHEEVNGEWEEIEKVNENVKTVADAKSVVSEIATYSETRSTSESGFYEDEALTLYTNGSTNPIKIAGKNKTDSGIRSCVYIKPTILTDKSVFISNATLTVTTGAVDTTGNNNRIEVFRLKNTLSQPQNATLPYYDDIIYDRQLATSDNNYCELDITAYAHYVSLGVYKNTGLALEPNDPDNTYIEISSIVLGIYYREIGDVDKNIESETVDLGRAGKLYINDYTCSPLIVRNDLGIYDELAEVNIQTIINAAAIDANVSDGSNTRTNYYSTLEYASGEYYWKNCEGDYIYFVRNTDTKYVGVNSAGESYVLTCSGVEEDFEHITIKYVKNDKNTTTYHFKSIDSKGYLTKIEYTFTGEDGTEYTNEVSVSYSGNNISYITDGSGRKYKYNYTNGMLSSISVHYYENGIENPVKINDEEIKILYSYDEKNRLKDITYPDDRYITYTYDDNNRLTNIKSYESTDTSVLALKELSLVYNADYSNSNILKAYTLINKGKTAKQIRVNSLVGSSYNRVFHNAIDNTEKIMQYNYDSNLVHYKDYNGQEYYLNYSNGKLQKLIYEDTETKKVVENGTFEDSSYWSTIDEASITENAPIKDDGNTSNKALAFVADKHPEGVTQTVSVTPGKSYVLSCAAYCKQTLPFKYDGDNKRYFSVKVAGSASGTIVGETSFDYNIVGNWQTSKIIINIPSTMSKVKITINSYDMPGTCYFDDLSMYLVNSENTDDVSDSTPISSDEILRNPHGQITDIIRKRVDNKTIGKHYEYDAAHYKSLVNDEGKTTYYDYDCGSGLLMSKGKNNDSTKNTKYIYSGIGALTAVEQAITSATGETVNQGVEYNYDDDVLTSIYHNGSLYEYTYNEQGLVENITVKESQEENANTDFSISYDYNKGNVGVVNFGNGSSITYTYEGNRITKTIYDNGKTGDEKQTYIYSYEYSPDGEIKKMTDEVSNTVTVYSENGSTITKNGTTIYSNNGKKMNLFGNSFTYSHSESKSNNTTTIKESSSASLIGPNVDTEVVLDGFNRTINSKITNKASTNINTHYRITNQTEYLSSSDNKETSLVTHYKTSIDKRKNRLSETYNNTRLSDEWFYEYDDVGRIKKVFKKSTSEVPYSVENQTSYPSEKGNLVRYYEYDEAGQLSLEANLEANEAICYNYDAGGNITKKTRYSSSSYNYNYDTEEFTFNPTYSGFSKTYTYKSNGMTDYLTLFNGAQITYDKSGNPVNYFANTASSSFRGGITTNNEVSGTMKWNGNLLTSFKTMAGDYYYEYTYDGDGRRTSKTYYLNQKDNHPKSIIEYIWEGDTLVGYHTVCYGVENGENNQNKYVLNWDKTIKLIYSNEKLVGASVVAGKNEATNSEWSEYFDWEQSGNYSFVHDGQGNITKIYDANEQVIVSMSYDAYGNMKQEYTGAFVKKLIDENPPSGGEFAQWLTKVLLSVVVSVYTCGMFLSVEQGFDGYIFDQETGLYYGQQRYYCPSWGRFLNASDPMTLTEDMSNIYNANLFNYCGNDPINNVTKTGFNAPCTVISDAILPQVASKTNNLINEDRSTAKTVGEMSTAFDVLGLGLSTTNDSAAQSYWDEAFDKKKDVVDNGYGLNYVQSAISKNTSSVTRYSVNKMNTPYKTTESIE